MLMVGLLFWVQAFRFKEDDNMKSIKLIFTFVLVFLLTSFLVADDKYTTVPVIKNHLGGSTITITFAANTDSTGSQHSYPIFIGNVNDNDGFVKAITNAAADFNILYHFSNDLTRWLGAAASELDAVSTTAKYDTLGASTHSINFHKFSWMVVECDGQAGTNSTDILYWEAHLRADVAYPSEGGQALKHSFYTTTNVTNP